MQALIDVLKVLIYPVDLGVEIINLRRHRLGLIFKLYAPVYQRYRADDRSYGCYEEHNTDIYFKFHGCLPLL